jgi:hypothetical protein
MLTGELRSKIDNVWNAFWAGGIGMPPTRRETRQYKERSTG